MAIALPALICLAAIEAWRFRCLSGDTWFLLGEFMDLGADGSWLREIFTRVNEHWLVPCKAGLFAGLTWLRGDIDRLTLLAWISAVLVMVMLVRESRSWLAPRSRGHAFVVWLVAALFVFTLKQSYFLLWEACFFLHFPLLALALMIRALDQNWHWTVRVMLAALAGVASVFSFGMGVVAAWALFPMIWLGGRSAPVKVSVAWLVVALGLSVLQFSGIDTLNSDRGSLAGMAELPGVALRFFLAMLGSPLAGGTSFEPIHQGAVLGAAGLILLGVVCVVLWQRRKTEGLARAAAPWLAWCLFGLGATALVTVGRFNENLGIALTGRYVALALPFFAGLWMLGALLWGKGKGFGVFATVVILAQVLNWHSGALEMRHSKARSRQEAAGVALFPFLPLDALPRIEALEKESRLRELVPFLRREGLLSRVPELKGVRVADFRLRSELASGRAGFDRLFQVEGGWQASGRAVLPWSGVPPDMILFSFETDDEEARIIDTTVPILPTDFYSDATRLRQNRAFYHGWQRLVSHERLPAGKSGWLRAWAFDVEKNRLAPMAGRHRVSSVHPSEAKNPEPAR